MQGQVSYRQEAPAELLTPQLQEVATRIAELRECVADQRNRLEVLADGIYGPQPPHPAETGSVPGSGSGALPKIGMELDILGSAISALSATISRLVALA